MYTQNTSQPPVQSYRAPAAPSAPAAPVAAPFCGGSAAQPPAPSPAANAFAHASISTDRLSAASVICEPVQPPTHYHPQKFEGEV
jgi:hypothetical protein